MALDPYAICPCGSGKKLKFCCSDLIHEMEKIQRMLEGDQPIACLKHVSALLEKQPSRESLLGLQAALQLRLEQYEEAEKTITAFLAQAPANPIALAESSRLKAATTGGVSAIEPLQRALAALDLDMPSRVYEAIGEVGQALLSEGKIFASRAHLLLQAGIGGQEDTRAAMLLMRLSSAEQIPLPLRDDPELSQPPKEVDWKDAFIEALKDAAGGKWLRAEERFEALLEPSGQAPQVWRNLALVRGYLGKTDQCLETLHKVAALDIPLDDAVETEALAQVLNPEAMGEEIDVVESSFVILDSEAFEPAMATDRRMSRMAVDPQMVQEGAPPPRAVFLILDRPEPESGVDLKLHDAPSILGYANIFGRETDREARVEVIAERGEPLDTSRKIVQEIGGSALGETGSEEVVSKTAAISRSMSWNWRLPDDTPNELRIQLVAEKRRQVMFEDWPQLELPVLGGMTPAEAAKDKSRQVPVLAAILLLELATDVDPKDLDFNDLRKQLELPTADPIDPSELDGVQMTIARMHRIMADKFSDEELVMHFRRTSVVHAREAILNLAKEVVSRDNLKDKVDQVEVYGVLAECQREPAQSLPYLEQARSLAESRGDSSAPWDLAELAIHIELGHTDQAHEMLQHIRSEHMEEPGVAQRMTEILMAAGVIGPDGMPVGPPPEAESSIVVPGGQEAASGELWTPESASAGGGEKSKLWTPD